MFCLSSERSKEAEKRKGFFLKERGVQYGNRLRQGKGAHYFT